MHRASGAMDNASDYGSEDSRFDSWLARGVLFVMSGLDVNRVSLERIGEKGECLES